MPVWPILDFRPLVRPARNAHGARVWPEFRKVEPDGFILAIAEGIDEVFTGETVLAVIEKWNEFADRPAQ